MGLQGVAPKKAADCICVFLWCFASRVRGDIYYALNGIFGIQSQTNHEKNTQALIVCKIEIIESQCVTSGKLIFPISRDIPHIRRR